MKTIKLYTKSNCHLCEDAKQLLLVVKEEVDFKWKEVDIYTDDILLEKYQLMIPVVEVDGIEVDYGQINYDTILQAIKS
ncbi:glutaredoxin family protein [Aquibacillus kalidii]|uniref:glutaredoxin family protein n=1 Tax=Aquibacillus kalidii TaxID=2762597 RepID=UPI0016461519|nr:glutaredoxin family protein [Aquibacillus kalidii]